MQPHRDSNVQPQHARQPMRPLRVQTYYVIIILCYYVIMLLCCCYHWFPNDGYRNNFLKMFKNTNWNSFLMDKLNFIYSINYNNNNNNNNCIVNNNYYNKNCLYWKFFLWICKKCVKYDFFKHFDFFWNVYQYKCQVYCIHGIDVNLNNFPGAIK